MKLMLLLLVLCFPAIAQVAEHVDPYKAYIASRTAWNQGHYTKTETYIPMRDGKKLFTVIFTPMDQSKTYPILLNRTPYSQHDGAGGSGYGKEKPVPFMADIRENCFAEDGFILVGQDVRGRYLSAKGDFEEVRPIGPSLKPGEVDESTDAYDTIEWLVANVPGNNGRVGIYGQSYDGFYASCALVRQHPALKAAILSAPVTDWWDGDDVHRNGALRLAQNFFFYGYAFMPHPAPVEVDPERNPTMEDGYTFFLKLAPLTEAGQKLGIDPTNFWNDIVRHPNRDAFGKARDVRPHLKGVKAAVMTVGGWFDSEDLFGSLNTYKSLEAKNPGIQNSLVMGPWVHGSWRDQGVPRPHFGGSDQVGSIQFGHRLGLDFQEKVELPFLRHHLKNQGTFSPPEALVFRTGVNRWESLPAWPPRQITPTPA